MAITATTQTFDTEVINSEGKVLVDFWAEWCGPCHAVSPVLDRIADEHNVKLVKVNIDEEQELQQRYGVASIDNALPASVTLDGAPLTADTDYFATVDPASTDHADTRLWITINRNWTGSHSLVVH